MVYLISYEKHHKYPMMKAFPVVIDRQCPNLFRSIGTGSPVGYFHIKRWGLGPHIKFEGKIWGKFQPNLPNTRKNLGSSVTTRRKIWEKSLFWGHIGNSDGKIRGTCYLHFWRHNLGLQQEFGKQILGHSPPTS